MFTVHTHVQCKKKKLLFWMWLIAINGLTAQIILYDTILYYI